VQQEEERRTFTSFLEEAERDRRQRAAEENRRLHGMVSDRLSDDRAGPLIRPLCITILYHNLLLFIDIFHI
jgi:hypothetical protein